MRIDIFKNLNENHHLKVRYASHFSAIPPPCPVPLYYYPPPHPLSLWPCIPISLPPSLNYNRNPLLRVRMPSPWAQTIQLFESDAMPHRYMCVTKYSTKGKAGVLELSPVASHFDLAMASFKKFFKLKTGVVWESRLDPRKNSERDAGGDGGCDQKFLYRPPTKGQPKGMMEQKTRREKMEQNDGLPILTKVLPSVEVDDAEIECSAKTPDGGW